MQGLLVSCSLRPGRLHITPIKRIDRIHLRKIVHVRYENIDLDDLCDIRPSGIENMGYVFDALMLVTRQRQHCPVTKELYCYEGRKDLQYAL